ncbi:hypothetical protein ACPSKX_18095 [Moritella viscosa]
MSVQIATPTGDNIWSRLQSHFKRFAFHHKKAEAILYLMFLPGLLLWPFITIPWQVERTVLLMHMLAGISIFPVFVVCTLTGVYLTFWGNTGNNFSILMQDIHFYSSWLLAPLVLRHAWRWTVIKFFRKS